MRNLGDCETAKTNSRCIEDRPRIAIPVREGILDYCAASRSKRIIRRRRSRPPVDAPTRRGPRIQWKAGGRPNSAAPLSGKIALSICFLFETGWNLYAGNVLRSPSFPRRNGAVVDFIREKARLAHRANEKRKYQYRRYHSRLSVKEIARVATN